LNLKLTQEISNVNEIRQVKIVVQNVIAKELRKYFEFHDDGFFSSLKRKFSPSAELNYNLKHNLKDVANNIVNELSKYRNTIHTNLPVQESNETSSLWSGLVERCALLLCCVSSKKEDDDIESSKSRCGCLRSSIAMIFCCFYKCQKTKPVNQDDLSAEQLPAQHSGTFGEKLKSYCCFFCRGRKPKQDLEEHLLTDFSSDNDSNVSNPQKNGFVINDFRGQNI
jgi:hypothetical protein